MTGVGGLHGRRFASVRAWRAPVREGPVRVHAAPNGGVAARLGLSTPGMRGAVERNRLRRRLREASRGLLAGAEGYDLIVSAGTEALSVPFAELTRQVGEAARVALVRARGPRPGAARLGAENGGHPLSARDRTGPPRGAATP